MAVYLLDNEAGDPHNWRDGCTDETKPVAGYMDCWKDCFRRLDWFGYSQEGEILPGDSPQESEVRCFSSAVCSVAPRRLQRGIICLGLFN